MSPKFTKHGEQRAGERGITSKEIDSLLMDENTIVAPSSSDSRAVLAIGKAGGKLWVIVCNKETDAVITVRQARPKERRLYEEKNGN